MRMSYAQNLEDYHLDMIFAGQADGAYVDVGGGHPVADNVSIEDERELKEGEQRKVITEDVNEIFIDVAGLEMKQS